MCTSVLYKKKQKKTHDDNVQKYMCQTIAASGNYNTNSTQACLTNPNPNTGLLVHLRNEPNSLMPLLQLNCMLHKHALTNEIKCAPISILRMHFRITLKGKECQVPSF
jgi:hypothetical protein